MSGGLSVVTVDGLSLVFMIVGGKARKVARLADHLQCVLSVTTLPDQVSVGPEYKLTAVAILACGKTGFYTRTSRWNRAYHLARRSPDISRPSPVSFVMNIMCQNSSRATTLDVSDHTGCSLVRTWAYHSVLSPQQGQKPIMRPAFGRCGCAPGSTIRHCLYIQVS